MRVTASIEQSEAAQPTAGPCEASGSAARASAWVSRGLESLEAEGGDEPFDVLIVGSGYGGAVAADRLAGCTDRMGKPLRIGVLERGREYLSGAFPRSLADLAGHVRFTTPDGGRARGELEGLFDVRVGADMSVLLANGVGGGSLINAGVMLFPEPEVFAEAPWPKRLEHADLLERSQRLRRELGGGDGAGKPNVIDDASTFEPRLARRQALRRIDPAAFTDVPLSIALQEATQSVAGVALNKCIGCGDCASGCNHGAKNSLDLGLLRRAQQRGVAVYAGATVSTLRKAGRGWQVDVWHTDLALRRRMAGPLRLTARRLILAAGTLGSTEILLRSQTPSLQFSNALGKRFSGNGDVLAALYDCDVPMNGAACEAQRPSQRHMGPTITGMLDWRTPDPKADAAVMHQQSCLVQDLGVPGALRRVLEEVATTADLLHRLDEADATQHSAGDPDPCAVDPEKMARTAVLAIIGRDGADGVMQPIEAKPHDDFDAGLTVDPGVRIDWPQARDDPRIAACQQRLESRLADSIGGRLLPNPAWQLLPQRLSGILGTKRGPLLTVHPLGGCAMGSTCSDGVVDHLGRVFDATPGRRATATHSGLSVLDGSIVPTSLGVNPALTIAVLADRAITTLVDRARASKARPAAAAPKPQRRPVFVRNTDIELARVPTEVEVVERLTGRLQLEGKIFFTELSLAYRPFALTKLSNGRFEQALEVAAQPQLSRLRIFADAPPPQDGEHRIHRLDLAEEKAWVGKFRERENALVDVPIERGTLRVLSREASSGMARRWRGGLAWFANRGLRDIYQEFTQRAPGAAAASFSLRQRLYQLLALASHAGEVRRFDYRLFLDTSALADLSLPEPFAGWRGAGSVCIEGHKRLTYQRRVGPWAQLMRMELSEFGGLRLGTLRRIEVSPSHFARMQMPLLRITRALDLPSVYSELGGFGMVLLRILLRIHLWSFRKPDRQIERPPLRLPGPLPGLPQPTIHEIDAGDGRDAKFRLTAYPKPGAKRAPVLLIHGYSASGTTFAHPALPCSLAAYLWRRGAEPWVLDLRSSCGMPSGNLPWTFEDMAEHDIPGAVEFVRDATGAPKIDVISHCMGSAMFAMGVLGPDRASTRVLPYLRRWVMSQVTPAVLFSPANMLRAYLLRYALNVLPQLRYSIRGEVGQSAVDADAFDRFLAALPYLGEGRDSEFDVENPPWWRFWQQTPWLRTRHRLDALFGRVFDARRLTRQTLEHIDDLFGEISLATASQTIFLAQQGFVASHDGLAEPYRLAFQSPRLANVPMLSLHARDNGLVDWETGYRFAEDWTAGTALHHEALMVEGCGHQDLLIGRDAGAVFDRIDRFLLRDFNVTETGD